MRRRRDRGSAETCSGSSATRRISGAGELPGEVPRVGAHGHPPRSPCPFRQPGQSAVQQVWRGRPRVSARARSAGTSDSIRPVTAATPCSTFRHCGRGDPPGQASAVVDASPGTRCRSRPGQEVLPGHLRRRPSRLRYPAGRLSQTWAAGQHAGGAGQQTGPVALDGCRRQVAPIRRRRTLRTPPRI